MTAESALPVRVVSWYAQVIVRHGGKHVEEKLVRVGEYLRPLERLFAPGCLGSKSPSETHSKKHVLLVTETAAVVRNFSHACAQRGWNCFWTAQRRLDLDIDPCGNQQRAHTVPT